MHPVDRIVPRHRGSRRAFAVLAAVAACLALAVVPPIVGASSSVVECGQLAAYVAPDPIAPTDGSLTIGMLTPWVIAADADVGTAGATLVSFAGSGPTCLALDLDDANRITALDFAPTGTITGLVVADSGVGGYVLAERLIVPSFITDAYPELAAVIVTSEAAGTPVIAGLTVDTTTGGITGVHITASFCGKASLDDDGNGVVGHAVIPAAVLDAESIAALEAADGHRRCAEVVTDGTVGQELQLSAEVTITGGPAPTRGPTPTPPETATAAALQVVGSSPSTVPFMAALAAASLALLFLARVPVVRRPRDRERRPVA